MTERGTGVGASLREWPYVRVFSPWQCNADATAQALLGSSERIAPVATDVPTGGAIVDHDLQRLAPPSRPRGCDTSISPACSPTPFYRNFK